MTGVEAEWDRDQGKYKLYTRYGKEIAGDDVGATSLLKQRKENRSKYRWEFPL